MLPDLNLLRWVVSVICGLPRVAGVPNRTHSTDRTHSAWLVYMQSTLLLPASLIPVEPGISYN